MKIVDLLFYFNDRLILYIYLKIFISFLYALLLTYLISKANFNMDISIWFSKKV